jgi:hypothetical protein
MGNSKSFVVLWSQQGDKSIINNEDRKLKVAVANRGNCDFFIKLL